MKFLDDFLFDYVFYDVHVKNNLINDKYTVYTLI